MQKEVEVQLSRLCNNSKHADSPALIQLCAPLKSGEPSNPCTLSSLRRICDVGLRAAHQRVSVLRELPLGHHCLVLLFDVQPCVLDWHDGLAHVPHPFGQISAQHSPHDVLHVARLCMLLVELLHTFDLLCIVPSFEQRTFLCEPISSLSRSFHVHFHFHLYWYKKIRKKRAEKPKNKK